MRDGERLIEDYAAVKPAGDPRWTLVAIARTGMVLETPPDALARVPATDAATCAALTNETVAPTVTVANDVAKWCHDTAAERGYSGPEVSRCDAVVTMLGRVARR